MLRRVPQCLPEKKYRLGQVPLFYMSIRPQRIENLLPVDDFPPRGHQQNEQTDHFRRQWHRLPVLAQMFVRDV